MALPPWCIPAAQWLLIQITTGLAAGFLPASSKLRPAIVMVIVALAYSFQFDHGRHLGDTRISGPLTGVCWANVFNAIDILLFSRINYKSQIDWEKKRHENTPSQEQDSSNPLLRRLRWSIGLPFGYRRIGTPWQITNLPMFDENNSRFAPSRLAFLAQAILKLCASVFILAFVLIEPDAPGVGNMVSMISDGSPSLIPKLTDTSPQGAIAQLSFILAFGLMSRSAFIATYYLLATISVALHISEPVSWPPITDSVTKARSIQQFWNSVWHQCYRSGMSSSAKFITLSILNIRSKTTISRYVYITLTFVISGFMHTMMDHGFGIPIDKSGSMTFFVLQAVGMMIENCVSSILPNQYRRGDSIWRRVLDYIWVTVFLGWSARFWAYSLIGKLYETGQPLPSPFLIPGSYRLLVYGDGT